MAYQKHNWVTREVIRREYLQNIEDGIYNEQERGEDAETTLDTKISGEIRRAQSKETELLGLINGLDSDITDEVNRATNKESDIETALNAEITRAVEAESQLSDLISANSNAISTESSRAQNAESSLSSNISSEVSRATQAESDIRDYVDQKIATTFKPSGSIYFADLPPFAESRIGNVYNIKDAFTTTADFYEGAGHDYPIGTNVGIVQVEEIAYTEVTPTGEENPSEEVWYELVNDEYVLSEDTEVDETKTYYVRTDYAYYYDVMAGFIDYSQFAQQSEVDDISNVYGAKNLLPYPYLNTTRTTNGITFTDNGDGSLTVNGTATANAFFNLSDIDWGNVSLSNQDSKYICTGGFEFTSDFYIGYNTSNKITSINIMSGTTVDNVTVYPMIRLKSIKNDTWQPYTKTNRELTQQQYTFVGTCNSTANEQHKVVTVDSGFKLEKGVRIAVKFSNSNTFVETSSERITLNVNNTGAKRVYYSAGSARNWVDSEAFGAANQYCYYIYDGTYWVWDGHNKDTNTTYSNISVSELKAGTATNQRTVRADYLNQAITEMIEEHGGSGHTIVDSSGTELTSRSKLKFLNATVTDDATNDVTIVEPSGSQITVDSSLSSTSTNPVQNKVINNALKQCVPQLNSAPTYTSLADLWTAADTLMNKTSSKFCVIRCKLSTNFGMGTGWFRLQISSQNSLGNGDYDVTGSIIKDDGKSLEYYKVTGGKTDTSDLAITKLFTSTIDTTPTSGSNNLITSGGVYSQIQTLTNKDTVIDSEISDVVNVLGAKNLLPNNATSQVINGVTFVVNDDGSVTANGTSTGWISLEIYSGTLKKGEYILSDGGVSVLGAERLEITNAAGTEIIASSVAGANVSFSLADDTAIIFRLACGTDKTVSNKTFYPMIRSASIEDDTYVPYAMTNQELTKAIEPKSLLKSVAKQVTLSTGVNYVSADGLGLSDMWDRVIAVSTSGGNPNTYKIECSLHTNGFFYNNISGATFLQTFKILYI